MCVIFLTKENEPAKMKEKKLIEAQNLSVPDGANGMKPRRKEVLPKRHISSVKDARWVAAEYVADCRKETCGELLKFCRRLYFRCALTDTYSVTRFLGLRFFYTIKQQGDKCL